MSSGWKHRSPLAALTLLASLASILGVAHAQRPTPPPAAAPGGGGSGNAAAERHAADGRRHLERGQYQEAIAAYREAYELQANPLFLHEIAEAYRQLGINDRALFFYDRYLETRPDAPDREAVEKIIAELAATGPAPPAPAPGPAAVPRAPQPSATAVTGTAPSAATVAPQPPVWRRWWLWGAAALVITGVGAALASGGGQSAPPATALGSKRFF